MKNFIIIVAAVGMFIFLVYGATKINPGRRSYNFNPPVEVGQTWVGVDSLDPFRPAEYDTVIVLEMKNGYSKVLHNGDTTSMVTDIVNWKRTLLKK